MTGTGWKRPESVLVLVYTRSGQVLLLERVRPAGFWQSVTGSLEWGESAASAAGRELFEETGIVAQPVDCRITNRFPIRPEWRHRYHPDAHENLEHVFSVMLPAVCEVRISPQEHGRYQWLDAAEARAQCSSWTNAEAIEKLLLANLS